MESDAPRILRPISGGADGLRIARAVALIGGVREGRDPEHAARVASLAARIAAVLGLDPTTCDRCAIAGWLHDIGMLALPDAALAPGHGGSPEQRAHASIGAELVRRVDELAAAGPGIRHHHERWDGEGYPDGLAGNTIPIEARVLAVADAVAALAPSAVLDARGRKQAAIRLSAEAGARLDPAAVDAALAVLADEAADHGQYLRIA